MPKVENITIEELKEMIEQAVENKLLELLGDPDEGLDLRNETRKRLKKSLEREQKGTKAVQAPKVAKKLRTDW